MNSVGNNDERRNEFSNPSSKELEPVPNNDKLQRPKVPRQGDPVYIDYLDEDPEIPSQKFFLFSYVRTKDTINGEHTYGIKVRGCGESVESLKKRTEMLTGLDPNNNLYTGTMGMWLPICPNPEDIGDQEYQNDLLNDIMKGKRENEVKAKMAFEERKRALMEKAIEDGTPEGQKRLANMNNHPKAVELRIETLKKDIKECQEQEERLHNLLREEKRKMDAFTYEELQEAERQVKEWADALDNAENPQEVAMKLADKYGAETITAINKLKSKPENETETQK